MPASRRQFLAAIGLASVAAPYFGVGRAASSTGFPPVRTVTGPPGFHWFGYYDKLEFDPSGRYLLGMRVDFEHRSPGPDDTVRVGMVDLKADDKWIDLGSARTWGWQQGCMLQWIPGSKSQIIWNDRDGDRQISRILDVFTREQRVVPCPIYALSPDGTKAVSTDFRRIQDTRPGYGYAGIPDPYADQLAPRESGIWLVDLRTGESRLIISMAQVAAIPFQGDPAEFKTAKHWFNHLLFNTDGSRFLFLHRWRPSDPSIYRSVGGFGTRMFTANLDGSELFVLDPNGKTSHFVWRDPQTVTAWAWHPSHGSKFYNFTDRTRNVRPVGPDVMQVNGHNTYVPGTNNEWILNDTYPDAGRFQNPYLFHVPGNRRIPLGRFYLPPEYSGEWRCDLHPRCSPDGKLVAIDSPHTGKGRQIHLIDISGLLG